MQFKEIKIADLKDFLESDLYLQSKNIPITKQRALSQMQNPRADKDAIALIIALNNKEEVIGFIGALPEKIPNLNLKVTWNSCWWIDKKKGKQVAIPLFLKFLRNWNYQVLFRDLTDKTEQIIIRFKKFEKIKKLTGYRYFFRLDSAKVLSKKYTFFRLFTPILKFGDMLFNRSVFLKNKMFLKSKNTNFIAIKVDKIGDEIEKFILQNNKNELFKRSKKELNWILNNPWILNKSLKKKNQFYYFSDTSAVFKNYIYTIYDKQKNLIAVLFLNNNNGLIKVPYAYFLDKNTTIIVSFLYQFLLQEKATSLFLINPKLNAVIQTESNPFWHTKSVEKGFYVSKKLAESLPENFDFQDGEGDFVFT